VRGVSRSWGLEALAGAIAMGATVASHFAIAHPSKAMCKRFAERLVAQAALIGRLTKAPPQSSCSPQAVRPVQSATADEAEGALLATVAPVCHVRVQVGNVRQVGSCARRSQLCTLRSGLCVCVL
jgi:hypothetical protein